MVSLAAFLKYRGDKPFGGVLGLSGNQPLAIDLNSPPENAAVLKQIPLFLYHGNSDDMIPVARSTWTYEYLKTHFSVHHTTEDGLGHTTSPKELEDIRSWILPLMKN